METSVREPETVDSEMVGRLDSPTVEQSDSETSRRTAVRRALAEARAGCPFACGSRATSDGPRKSPSCANCIYAAAMRDGDQTLPICANTPNAPGEIVRIDPAGKCPNYGRKPEPVIRGVPPEPAGDDMRYIPLTRGKYAIVDVADYGWLSQYKWHVVSPGKQYAGRKQHGKTIYMHREIMQPPEGMCVDHVAGFTLDNRRANLRTCTPAENMRNRRGNSGRDLPKGVTYQKHANKYKASIGYDGVPMHIGYYDDPIEAAKAYDRKALQLFGEFARLNFPEEVERGSVDALKRRSGEEASQPVARPSSLVSRAAEADEHTDAT